MILDASTVESFERSRRRWAYEREWELNRLSPLAMLHSALDLAVTAHTFEPSEANAHVMRLAGERGVWSLVKNPYEMVRQYAHLAEVLARVLRQPTATPLQVHPAVTVGAHQWQPKSYLADGGLRLMRVVVADRWDDDRQLAELHSWRTVGDVSSTGLPMTLRVLVIGQSRDGKRHSHWTKAQRHPVNKQLRFARKHGKADGFAASWDTIWREQAGISAQVWLEQMARDGVLRELAFDRKVAPADKLQRERVLDDIKRISDELRAQPNHTYPMTRSACDDPIRGACPFQSCCFAPGLHDITPGDTGAFHRRPAQIKILTK